MNGDSVSIRPAAALGREPIAAEILEERPTYWVFRVEENRIHMSRDAVTVSPAPMGLPTSSSKAKRGLNHLFQGNVIEFTAKNTPQQTMVAEVLSVDFKEKMVELRIVKPWYGAIMKLPLDSIGKVDDKTHAASSYKRRKNSPVELEEASIRIFRPSKGEEGGGLVIFDTLDEFADQGFILKDYPREVFYRALDTFEDLFLRIQDYYSRALPWGTVHTFNPKKYKITSLICAAEHIHFLLRERTHLEHVHTLNLTMQGDYLPDMKYPYRKKDNDHLITDYFQWDKLLEERMQNITKVTFHIAERYIIPSWVWTMIYDGRFRMAREISFSPEGTVEGQTIHQVLKDKQNMLKVAKVCPFVPIGAYASIREKPWYASFVMTYLCCESLPREFVRIPPDVYALFARPMSLEPSDKELAVFDTEWLEYESPETIISELSPSQQRVYNELLIPLSMREPITVPVTFERAVMAVSLGAFYGVHHDILHYIIHTWCMRLYQEAPKSLMDKYDHAAIREVLKGAGMVVGVEEEEDDEDDDEDEDDLEGEDEYDEEEYEEEYEEEEEA
jgi:hypothetical protein